MRNVNLNILKFLESINNFCLSLSNIELGIGRRSSVVGRRSSVVSPDKKVFTTRDERGFLPYTRSADRSC
ncbi:MAG: hypothetical protein GPI96_16465 [Microcystis aeruginosa BS13-02]|nr:hypothetical protein [Microcystis aeruginosa BS13-02]